MQKKSYSSICARLLILESRISRCNAKLAKQISKDHEQEDKWETHTRHKDLTCFGQSTYVYKGDEQSNINMRVQNI